MMQHNAERGTTAVQVTAVQMNSNRDLGVSESLIGRLGLSICYDVRIPVLQHRRIEASNGN